MFFSYKADYDIPTQFQNKVLRIGNKKSVLEAESLLLGSTTKANDSRTIGQFGEGYKVACLVLLREGKRVTFYNYGKREIWRPRFVKSRKYKQEILIFEVSKLRIWEHEPDHNLLITVEGITEEEYEAIVASNLHLQEPQETIATDFGRIILDQKGKVYVNGLFVCYYNPYQYSYDFKTKELALDRDRKLAEALSLQWLASKMWSGVSAEYEDKLLELIKLGAADVEFINEFKTYIYDHSRIGEISKAAAKKFVEEHGSDAVPISSQTDFNNVPQGKKAVVVNEGYQKLITPNLPKEQQAVVITPKTKLAVWLLRHEQSLSKKAIQELKAILEELQ